MKMFSTHSTKSSVSLLSQALFLCGLCLFHFKSHGKTLDMSVGWTKPPYVIERNNSGFELELVSAIFKQMGHELNFVYVPFGRSNVLLQANKVDVALTMSDTFDIDGISLSVPYINYQNAAISLRGRTIELQSVSQLSKYTIVGFQNASLVLGKDYREAVEESPLYLELPDQSKQVEMLLKGKVDLVVMDINIFNYLSREKVGRGHMDNIDIHRLFPKSQYRLGFVDTELTTHFNHQFALFKQSIQYSDLVKKYKFLQ